MPIYSIIRDLFNVKAHFLHYEKAPKASGLVHHKKSKTSENK